MKKLYRIKLRSAVQLESNEMKQIYGGSGTGGKCIISCKDDGIFKYNAIGIEKMENSSIYLPDDKKKTSVKDLKQLQDFTRNKNRKVGIVLVKDGEATNYTIDNPVLLNTIELIN